MTYLAGIIGRFTEATSLTSNLETIEVESFHRVLQWIGTGGIVFSRLNELDAKEKLEVRNILTNGPAVKKIKDRVIRVQISQYIDLLIATDFLILTPDPVAMVVEKIRLLIVELWSLTPVSPEMITRVWQLPSSHPARELFAKACVEDYLTAKFNPDHGKPFSCEKELELVPGFATQLLDAVAGAMAKPLSLHTPSKELSNVTIKNPVDGSTIIVKKPEWDEKAMEDRSGTALDGK